MRDEEALGEETRSRMESLPVHNLREMRVHDSRQADRLARRLGGEASAAGGHGVNSPGNLAGGRIFREMHPGTRRDLPLAPGSAVQRSVRSEQKRGADRQKTVSTHAAPTRLPSSSGASSYAGRVTEGRSSLQRVEGEASPEEGHESNRADPAVVANMVYRMMLRDLVMERERGH
jgi:hypothetical protein